MLGAGEIAARIDPAFEARGLACIRQVEFAELHGAPVFGPLDQFHFAPTALVNAIRGTSMCHANECWRPVRQFTNLPCREVGIVGQGLTRIAAQSRWK